MQTSSIEAGGAATVRAVVRGAKEKGPRRRPAAARPRERVPGVQATVPAANKARNKAEQRNKARPGRAMQRQTVVQATVPAAGPNSRGQQGARSRGGAKATNQQEREDHPYHFRRLQHYETRYRSEQGRLEVLQRFDRRSNLLKGLKDYRVAVLEASPNTVVLPHHCDAESIYFVAKGNGIVNLVRKEKRQSYNVRYGDIFKVQAGTIIYLVNNHEREDLYIVKLAVPVNTPGHFEDFFGAGGENPESFYKSFSQGILEAAFNVDYGRLQKLFQQSLGPIVRVSREQIQALSRHSSNANSWIFGSDRRGDEEEEPYRITKRKTESNQYGQLYEVRPDDYNPLKKLGITVSFQNITNGGMVGPYYNSIATTLALVVDGSGYSEMVCPHLSSSSYERESQRGEWGEGQEGSRGEGQGQRGVSYTRARSNLSKGDWFIIPAGHPVATVSSANQNLQVLCFEVNSWTNEKIPLAADRGRGCRGLIWIPGERDQRNLQQATKLVLLCRAGVETAWTGLVLYNMNQLMMCAWGE
ncbi:hypothetical protein Syun_029294 [Stephania yunnanensis]|uniref:Cupin type-1 domain-containing protein n=1 Tax=Stephania yunnanensis TaxID=152371 RepID=A0AAP0E7P4_9MAGN